jgi:hypothetical protein
MNAEIKTKKIGSKWHGYIDGRPDINETALSEEAVRRKMEHLRDRIGTCGAKTKPFGGKACELIAGHHVAGLNRVEQRRGSVSWIEVEPDDPGHRKRLGWAA